MTLSRTRVSQYLLFYRCFLKKKGEGCNVLNNNNNNNNNNNE